MLTAGVVHDKLYNKLQNKLEELHELELILISYERALVMVYVLGRNVH